MRTIDADALKKDLTRFYDNEVTARQLIDEQPTIKQEPKTGHWIRISPAGVYECSECGHNVMTSDICAYKFCHGCGAKMVEPQESEEV